MFSDDELVDIDFALAHPVDASTAPRTKTDLRDYQQRLITHLYENDRVQVVVPMGGGKTATALTVLQEMVRDEVVAGGLILAPKRVAQLVWRQEAAKWAHLEDMRFSLVAGNEKKRLEALRDEDADIWICGIDNVGWLCAELKRLPKEHPIFGALIVDESSKFKSAKGTRAKELVRFMDKRSDVWPIRHFYTGTPRPNSWQDLWMPGRLLGAEKDFFGRSFAKWRDENFMSDYMGHNWEIMPGREEVMIERSQKYTITLADEDMPDLPELTVVDHRIVLPPDARAAYAKMQEDLIALIENDAVVAANAAVAAGKCCQIANGFLYVEEPDGSRASIEMHQEKLEVVRSIVDQAGDEPILIVYGYQADLHMLKDEWPHIRWLGAGTTDAQAEEYEREWNKGNIPLLALHPASAGHGLNLQESGNTMIFLDLPWSAELYEQTYKRFHRPGQKRHCTMHRIVASDTVDEVRIRRVAEKISMQDAFRSYLERV